MWLACVFCVGLMLEICKVLRGMKLGPLLLKYDIQQNLSCFSSFWGEGVGQYSNNSQKCNISNSNKCIINILKNK